MTGDAILATCGIGKTYAAPVLTDVGIELRRGEVHALIGANGAGKSTLARIICGLVRADSGTMTLFGEPYAPASKAESEHLGVHIVQQELNLIPTLSVGENLYLNRLPHRFGVIARGQLHADAGNALRSVGMGGVSPDTPVSRLGVGQQQLVEIASALSRNLRVLILDEPTATLTAPERDLLFERIFRLKASGVALIYISHRMEEIRTISDRVTVLRDGQCVATCAASEVSLDRMVAMMVGQDADSTSPAVSEPVAAASHAPGPVALRVEGLTRGRLTREVSFEVRRGEILGLAGLVGSGRTETLRAVFGADRPTRGSVAVSDPPVRVRIRNPCDAVRAGIGMIPEDRKSQGLLLTQSVRSNITLSRIREACSVSHWISPRRERAIADMYCADLAVKCDSCEQTVQRLSGGNQQKVLLARWLLRDCDILLFDEPTRGIDIAARRSIYAMFRRLAASGKALVVASSDLDELMLVCDRIAVMSAGRIAATFPRDEWSEDLITTAAFSGYAASAAST